MTASLAGPDGSPVEMPTPEWLARLARGTGFASDGQVMAMAAALAVLTAEASKSPAGGRKARCHSWEFCESDNGGMRRAVCSLPSGHQERHYAVASDIGQVWWTS